MLKPDGKRPKLYVIDPAEESRVPYLRGILTHALQDAGLSFEEAYKIANEVRERLWSEAEITHRGNEADITSEELKRVVADYLKDVAPEEVRERFLRSKHTPLLIQVVDADEQVYPFSKTYLAWLEFTRSGRPLILLVGGSTGSGKSTMSSEVAHRLNIVRTQSTDMLREVMRLMVPRRLIPTLHTSSYNAWKVLPKHERPDASSEINMIDGYLTQAEQVGIGIEGVMKRAEREQVSLILEGVHIHPRLQTRLRSSSSAVVVPMILAVLKKKNLRLRLLGRSMRVPTRTSQRYAENFDSIWQLQSFILSEADRLQVPIITNEVKEETILSMMKAISDVLLEEYEGDPEKLFHKPESTGVDVED